MNQAFPTCGLAMAESERYLPELITKLEDVLEENGLRQESLVMRMTGKSYLTASLDIDH